MNFEKAYNELLQGKNIRRKSWEPLMHLSLREGEIKAFRGEHSSFYGELSMMMTTGWRTVEDGPQRLTFIEAIEHLKNKNRITHESWKEHVFIFVDGENIAICKPVEYTFMPSFKDFCSQDWEAMK
jgi:hypothetical protein